MIFRILDFILELKVRFCFLEVNLLETAGFALYFWFHCAKCLFFDVYDTSQALTVIQFGISLKKKVVHSPCECLAQFCLLISAVTAQMLYLQLHTCYTVTCAHISLM